MDSIEERTNALKRMPLMASLPHGELEAIAKRLRVERYAPGVEIIKQGSNGSSAYLIVEGLAEVRRQTTRSNRRLAFLGPGDFFGELSVLAAAPRSASVRAQEPTVVLVLTGSELRTALRLSKAMALHMVKVLAERLQRTVDEFSELAKA